MKMESGKILDLTENIASKPGYTISKKITDDLVLFSLGKDTDITGEKYYEEKVFYILEGAVEVQDMKIEKHHIFRADKEKLIGVKALEDSIMLEFTIKGEENVNLEKGKVFRLEDLIEYVDGSITNLDLISKEGMKFLIMSFDEGEGLTPHSAPVDAMVMALEGEAKLTMGDIEAEIKAGEQFVFEKNIDHSVEAKTKFKMALLMA